MLLTITTTGKVTLLIVGGVFILWALITAMWIPKRNPDFPVTLTAFLVASTLLFVAQMGAVYWVTGTQEVKHEAAAGGSHGEESTPVETAPAETAPVETAPVETAPAETEPAETAPVGTEPVEGGAGDAAAGKAVFASAGCGSCHALADAGASGSVGPDLDEGSPSADKVVERVTEGKGAMPSFKGQLSKTQIADVAAYVSSVVGN